MAMVFSSIVHNPIVEPQVNGAVQRYGMVNRAYNNMTATYSNNLANGTWGPDGRLYDKRTQQAVGFRDPQERVWMYGGPSDDGKYNNVYTVNAPNGPNTQPSVTVMQLPMQTGVPTRSITMAPSPMGQMPGYHVSEWERNDRGQTRNSSYGLTPYGAVEH